MTTLEIEVLLAIAVTSLASAFAAAYGLAYLGARGPAAGPRRGAARDDPVGDGPITRNREEDVETVSKPGAEDLDRAPLLVWRETADGRVTWANAAYRAMLRASPPDEAAGRAPGQGALPRLFDPGARGVAGPDSAPRRVALDQPGAGRRWWFDCQSHAAPDGATTHFAANVTAAVSAEEALSNFTQTLTKTFAHLPIGLAIFDRDRQLALFNPALSDLTRLEPQWLSGRPTLYGFLDRLRDRRMIPEPRDYKSWRQRLADLEREATDGTYEETWTLPSGQTYQVTGQPHPEGAVAFMIADISSEMTLQRRYRSELELGQSVLDALDEAVAVFSPGGRMILSNDAYAALWGHDPASTLEEVGVAQATRRWQERTRPTPAWGDLRDFVTRFDDRAEWTAEVTLGDGRAVQCRFAPLAGGATLCSFRAGPDDGAGAGADAETVAGTTPAAARSPAARRRAGGG